MNISNSQVLPRWEDRDSPSLDGDVQFDANSLTLRGHYSDQLSVYRARKVWTETLEDCFLLDSGTDIRVSINCEHSTHEYSVECEFVSACARYAFWRLTNEHAPEAAYLIETAHIPEGPAKYESLVNAPDLRSAWESELNRLTITEDNNKSAQSIFERLRKIAQGLIG